MSNYNEVYLVCCDSHGNHNKYYKMIPHGSDFTVEYGRVGARAQRCTYPIGQWKTKYDEKIRKGYVDVTSTRVQTAVQPNKSNGYNGLTRYTDVEDAVQAIISELQMYATKTICANYRVNETQVSPKMITAVTQYICELEQILNATENPTLSLQHYAEQFNEVLERKIFPTIPRVMSSVSAYVIPVGAMQNQNILLETMSKLINGERKLLDIMRTKVVQYTLNTANTGDKATLAALGLEIKPCTEKDIALIKRELGEIAPRFQQAWCVKNIRTHNAFEKFKKEHRGDYQRFPIKLLWHGSRNENWWSIINNGLQLSPKSAHITGKMFGQGIYFAPKARKSMGYTSLRDAYWNSCTSDTGFMALYATAYGKPYNVDTNRNISSNFSWTDLQRVSPGAHCVHAHAGQALRNDEIIYYNESQCTIKYLVKLK